VGKLLFKIVLVKKNKLSLSLMLSECSAFSPVVIKIKLGSLGPFKILNNKIKNVTAVYWLISHQRL
jgi:hypothetical protein